MNEDWHAFLRGVASVADIFGVLHRPKIDRRSVAEVLADDWRTVCEDGQRAFDKLLADDPAIMAAHARIVERRSAVARRTPRRPRR